MVGHPADNPPDDSSAAPRTGDSTEIGPWGMVPIWVLDVTDTKGQRLSGADLRVYVALRSFADRSGRAHPFVESIADRARVGKRSAEKSITRLRSLGLVSTTRRYRDDGSIAGCDYHLRNDPPGHMTGTPTGDMAGTLPVTSPGPSRPNGRSKNTPREHTKRTQGTELNWPSADAAGDDAAEPALTPINGSSSARFEDWNAEDYELFRFLIGADSLYSDGSTWPEGEHTTAVFYRSLRQRTPKPIKWPGRYFDQMNTTGGIDSWLNDQGLESL